MTFVLNTGETIPQEQVLTSLRLFTKEVIPAMTKPERSEAAKLAEALKAVARVPRQFVVTEFTARPCQLLPTRFAG